MAIRSSSGINGLVACQGMYIMSIQARTTCANYTEVDLDKLAFLFGVFKMPSSKIILITLVTVECYSTMDGSAF